jgi:hypothetical protein
VQLIAILIVEFSPFL